MSHSDNSVKKLAVAAILLSLLEVAQNAVDNAGENLDSPGENK